jgi:diguanylate cyclase (GGDEF)-like protein
MARSIEGFRRTPVMCGYTKGVLSQASALFGMNLATVEELECQARGGNRCLYRVSWDPSTIEDNLQRRVDQLEAELRAITTRFEALQATASDLAGARDVEELLSLVADRAADTVRAPRHVLAVRTAQGGSLQVHVRGFHGDDVSGVVHDVMADQPSDEGGSRLIVDIASRSQTYGRLAAIYPHGACFLPAERRLLTAYAGHAAAALEAAAARQEAERRNATARALLALASSLAQVGTRAEVATRLADAVPHVVDCANACVFLCDDDSRALLLYGASGLDQQGEERLRATPISAAEEPSLAAMMEDPHPRVFAQSAIAERLRLSGDNAQSGSVVVVPIAYRREFFGVVTATVDSNEQLGDDEHLLERLLGMADHAATALLNARLLEQIRHQATHDGLTDLPNRLLLKDRIEQALALIPRTETHTALFFVDLDDFKNINDSLGHAAGDQLLIQVATRLRHLVRPSDTVARLGGDEFVVVASGLDDVHAIDSLFKRLDAGLGLPYEIEGAHIKAPASIGVSVMSGNDTYETLLRNGDEAMYEAKRARKARPDAKTESS